jgi:hypothetical protein
MSETQWGERGQQSVRGHRARQSCGTLYGVTEVDNHPELLAYQTRGEWTKAGLEHSMAIISKVQKLTMDAVDPAGTVEAYFPGKSWTFRQASDPEALMRYFNANNYPLRSGERTRSGAGSSSSSASSLDHSRRLLLRRWLALPSEADPSKGPQGVGARTMPFNDSSHGCARPGPSQTTTHTSQRHLAGKTRPSSGADGPSSPFGQWRQPESALENPGRPYDRKRVGGSIRSRCRLR